MSPYQLQILLWYYAHADDWPEMEAPIWPETRDHFMRIGMLDTNSDYHGQTYSLTEKARFYLDHLMAIPLPIQEWTIP